MRLLKLVPDNTNIGFVRLRWVAFAFTLLLTIGSIVLLITHGLNRGVDFEGGLLIEARFEQPIQVDELRKNVNTLGLGESSIQEFGNNRTFLIRLPNQSEASDAKLPFEMLAQQGVQKLYPDVSIRRVEKVLGKISEEIEDRGKLAVALAMLGVALFSWLRFEWHFGVSTLVALIHDVIVTLGFFALTQWEFDLNIVAAMLTIIGYSLNDKIVVDDRIRENLRKYRKMDMRTLIDLSVNETLSRTVVTTLSLILALGALLILGGDVLRGFTAAMLLGIFVGTYSSIFVSSSLLITLGLTPQKFGQGGGATDEDKRAERLANP